MGQERHVGKAPVSRPVGRATVRRPASAARADHAAAVVPAPHMLRTSRIRPKHEPPPPVFVDASGRRRRRVRRFAYVIGLAAVLFVAILWLSQTGDDVRPQPLVPCATAQGGPAERCAPLPATPDGAGQST